MRTAGLILLGLVLGSAEVLLGWLVLPRNFLGAFLIFIGLGYCIGGGFFLALGRGVPSRGFSAQSDRTLLYLAPGALLILLAMPLEYRFLPEVLPRARLMQWLGLIIIALGMALRLWARQALRQDYQGNLQVQAGQQVITSGPYHWVRHPGYAAFLLLALGLVVGFSSLSGLVGLALFVVGLRRRIRVEEQMLAQAFGEAYTGYMARTGGLFPRIQ